jgi:glucose-6-phosphate isomerase
MMDICFNDDNAKQFISSQEIDSLQKNVNRSHADLENKTGQGSDCLGWLHLPSQTPSS